MILGAAELGASGSGSHVNSVKAATKVSAKLQFSRLEEGRISFHCQASDFHWLVVGQRQKFLATWASPESGLEHDFFPSE